MSSIDAVISRSRQSNQMGEQKTFSIARNRAIEKMRNFALADPHYFALELIQGAVANGAEYIDIASEKSFFALSYIGGGFAEDDLSQLFDFLFASKQDMDQSALRQMALGVNALMLMAPEEITILSGDGTLQGTCQISIAGDRVAVGTPENPLRGTFISARGLKRKLVASRSNILPSLGGGPECTVIENRCLTAPVPFLVNDNSIFGYSSMKFPVLYGYDRVVAFDEGDLYGIIGIAERGTPRYDFKLLTYGVWAQTVTNVLLPGKSIGGIITFDRLNKTADHAAIVQDDRMQEMWARLAPYAERLANGESGKVTYTYQALNGQSLDAIQLREIMEQYDFILCVEPDTSRQDPAIKRALILADALNAPILRVPMDMRDALKLMAGNKAQVLQPDIATASEIDFYLQEHVNIPAQPWLLDKIKEEGLLVQDVVSWISGEEVYAKQTQQLHWRIALGDESAQVSLTQLQERKVRQKSQPADENIFVQKPHFINPTIYIPKNVSADENGVHVRVIVLDRLVWEGVVPCSYAGFVLDLELVDVLPDDVLIPIKPAHDENIEPMLLVEAMAHVCARHLSQSFEKATALLFESIHLTDIEVGGIMARRALTSIARDSLLRLRRLEVEDTQPSLTITMLSKSRLDYLSIPLLQTLDGQQVSVQDVVVMMREQHGLIYGVIPDVTVALDGLDQSRILSLSLWEERLILAIFGEASYIRIDVRNFLASMVSPFAHIRDMALGLRDYDHRFSLLVEHGDITELIESDADGHVTGRLVAQLMTLYNGDTTTLERTLEIQVDEIQRGTLNLAELCEENQRQALRHLQWFVCHQYALNGHSFLHHVDEMPMFLTDEGHACSFAQILEATANATTPLVFFDGRSRDPLHVLTKPSSPTMDASSLMMNTFVYELFKPHFDVQSAFDFDLSAEEAKQIESTPEDAFLLSKKTSFNEMDVHLGVPNLRRTRFSFACISKEGHVRSIHDMAEHFGLVGTIRSSLAVYEVERDPEVLGLCRSLMHDLINQIPFWSREQKNWNLGVWTLLRYLTHRIQLVEQNGQVVLDYQEAPLAQRILDMPLFETSLGMPVSARRLIQHFCKTHHMLPQKPWLSQLLPNQPEVLSTWLENILVPSSITKLSGGNTRQQLPTRDASFSLTSRLPSVEGDVVFCKEVISWLDRLRVDDVPLDTVFVVYPSHAQHASLMRLWGEADDKTLAPMYYVVERGEHLLMLNGEHDFIVHHRQRLGQKDQLSWLLLACYACINEVLEDVTNDHEMMFQARLIDTLFA